MRRRNFLIAAPAAMTAGPILATMATAQSVATSPVAAQRFRVGGATVTAILDGYLPLGPELMIGATPEDFTEALEAAHFGDGPYTGGVAAYLIDMGGDLTLVDTGSGPVFGPTLGHFGAAMATLGIDGVAIGRVVATHLHPDHIGGMLASGTNAFQQAELVASEKDHGFWTDADAKAQAPADFRGFFDLATATVGAFGDRLRLIDGEAVIAPGLTAMPLPGHTPGHMGVMLESEGDRLLIWGDIIHAAPLQLPRPDIAIAFDVDPAKAVATRMGILEEVARSGLQVAGMHLPFPGIGFIERAGEGYRFVPRHWDHLA